MFTLSQLELASMKIFKESLRKLEGKTFTMPATLTSCRICSVKFWQKRVVSIVLMVKLVRDNNRENKSN